MESKHREVVAPATLKPWGVHRQVAASLHDASRPGKPCPFTPGQVRIALACRPPDDFAVLLTQRTPAALAREAIAQRGCRADLSPTSRAFFKKEAELTPNLPRYGLNPTIEDPVQFAANVQQVSDLYRDAPALAEQGIRMHWCDEMTGIGSSTEAFAPPHGPGTRRAPRICIDPPRHLGLHGLP